MALNHDNRPNAPYALTRQTLQPTETESTNMLRRNCYEATCNICGARATRKQRTWALIALRQHTCTPKEQP